MLDTKLLHHYGKQKTVWVLHGASLYRGLFAQFITMREKRILARAIGIQKEICL